MGLSPYPSPSDGGVLCIILVGTAISISIVKDFILSILNISGVRTSPLEEYSNDTPIDFYDYRVCPSESYIEEFRIRTPSVKFGALSKCKHYERECSVCLTEFENDNEINHLSCGHVFHKMCLEKWLNYWNVTCPLCRTRMVPHEMEQDLYM